jgi:hypothetical protein
MITNFIYSYPTWLWGVILVVLFAVVSCGGLLLFHRLCISTCVRLTTI